MLFFPHKLLFFVNCFFFKLDHYTREETINDEIELMSIHHKMLISQGYTFIKHYTLLNRDLLNERIEQMKNSAIPLFTTLSREYVTEAQMSYRREIQETQTRIESQKRTHAVHEIEINISDPVLDKVVVYTLLYEFLF